jgi:hydroxyacylglutathione hydrolase
MKTTSVLREKMPPHLAGTEARGLVPGENVAQFELGPLRNFIYLLIDWPSRRAAIVDPQRDVATPLVALEKNGLTLERILLTHSHHDHVAGVGELLTRFPGIPLHAGEADVHRLKPEWIANLAVVRDGEKLRVGGAGVEVLATPGHSAGEVCYRFAGRYLCTGDTLFIRDCGRTDFDDGSDEQMFASLAKIRTLPIDTVILPGHHYQSETASLLEIELLESPPLKCRSVDELRKLP